MCTKFVKIKLGNVYKFVYLSNMIIQPKEVKKIKKKRGKARSYTKSGKPRLRRFDNYEIYVLYYPLARCIKYVGCTNVGLKARMKMHIIDARNSHRPSKKQAWIKNLYENGLPLLGRVVMKCENKAFAVIEEFELMNKIIKKRPLVNYIYKRMPVSKSSFQA